MRKLKLQMQVSVDGYVCGPNNEMDWMVWDWDNELKQFVGELTNPVDQILLGRKLAEGFIPAWESMAEKPADANEDKTFIYKMNDTAKTIFSRTLTTSNWKNATLATENFIEEITALKNQPGSDIIVYGGVDFVASLIQSGLIDEYHLFINPSAIGKGRSIFKELNANMPLKLISAKSFQCGIVALSYVPA